MKNIFKGKIATAIILLATFVLAGVAIFTAVRLYQLRQTSVAPNVPSSIPKAAGAASCGQVCNMTTNPTVDCAAGLVCFQTSSLAGASGICRNAGCTDKTDCTCTASSCSLSFTLTTPTPGLICRSKRAWLDNSKNIPNSYQLITEIPAGSNVIHGQKFVYTLSYENTGTTTVNSAIFTDTLPTQIDFVDADGGCVYASNTRVVTCNLGNVVAGGKSQRAVRVAVSTTASAGNFTNTANLQGTGVNNSQCQIALNLQTSTSTPTPTATPTATPTVTPTPTAVPQCNTTCTQNSGCPSNLICSIASGATTGNCRNTSCTGESDCICATATPTATSTVTPGGTSNPTPTATQPALPQSGTNWPTTFGIGIGILTIIGALLLAL